MCGSLPSHDYQWFLRHPKVGRDDRKFLAICSPPINPVNTSHMGTDAERLSEAAVEDEGEKKKGPIGGN